MTNISFIYQLFLGNGKDCTDNFRVKWWPDNEPNNYTLSKLLEPKVRQFTVAHLMPGTYYGFQVQSTIQNPDNVSTLLFVLTSIFKKRKALITKIDFVCVRGKIDAADDWIIYA